MFQLMIAAHSPSRMEVEARSQSRDWKAGLLAIPHSTASVLGTLHSQGSTAEDMEEDAGLVPATFCQPAFSHSSGLHA